MLGFLLFVRLGGQYSWSFSTDGDGGRTGDDKPGLMRDRQTEKERQREKERLRLTPSQPRSSFDKEGCTFFFCVFMPC